MPRDWQQALTENIRELEESCHVVFASVPKRVAEVRHKKAAEKRDKGDLSQRSRAVWHYLSVLRQSERFSALVEKYGYELGEMTENGALRPVEARKISLALLLLESNGIRGESLLKLSLKEWYKGVGTDDFEGNWSDHPGLGQVAIVTIESHKTSATYGGIRIPIRESVYFVINEYLNYAYRKLFPKPVPEELSSDEGFFSSGLPLFPSTRKRGELNLSLEESWRLTDVGDAMQYIREQLLLEGVKDPLDPDLRTFTSGALRKAFASFGNREQISGFTEVMGHSAVTASRHYVTDNADRVLGVATAVQASLRSAQTPSEDTLREVNPGDEHEQNEGSSNHAAPTPPQELSARPVPSRNKALPEDDREFIRALFQAEYQRPGQVQVSEAVINEKMNGNPRFKSLVEKLVQKEVEKFYDEHSAQRRVMGRIREIVRKKNNKKSTKSTAD